MAPAVRRLLAACVLAALLAVVVASSTALAALYVLDEANVIPADVETRIEALSAKLEAATPGAQVAVVTVPSLGGRTIEEYSEQRFEDLGIGQKGKDNGVLLLVAPTERKVRIEVGYGLEGALPDAKAGAIIDDDIIPAFKAGNLAAGIEAGHASIVRIVSEEYKVDVGAPPAADSSEMSGPMDLVVFCGLCLVIVLVFAFIFWLLRRFGGGGTGGGWTSGWSGGWTSGDSGGGGFDSGGGFGGGDSGGGGASGDW